MSAIQIMQPGELVSTGTAFCAEPYPIPQSVFDRLVEKYVGGQSLTDREKFVWDYVNQVNEVALFERKMGLVATCEDLDVSDEQLQALDMALTADGAAGAEDPFAWKDHDGKQRPVGGDVLVELRLRAGFRMTVTAGDVIWPWGDDSGPAGNIVAYRLARPGED